MRTNTRSSGTRSLSGRALNLGIAGGIRSMTPLAAIALTYHDVPVKRRLLRKAVPMQRGWRDWPVLSSPWGRALVVAMAASELVADKLPATPARIKPGSMVGRTVFTALAGAALGSERRGGAGVATGAAVAAVGAVIGAVGGYYARRALVDASRLPDPVVALGGDAAAIAISRSATTA